MATKIVTKNSSTASAVPTASDLVQGELAVNVADKRLFTEDNAGAIVELGTNPSGNVTFQDNGKAIFGAGSDLQIYHDGSHSYIADVGAGDLILQAGNDLVLRQPDGSTEYLRANEGAGVQIYHNGSQKFLTTSTGIDVTGTATMDGLTVSGSVAAGAVLASITNSGLNGAAQLYLTNDAQNWIVNTRVDDAFSVFNATASRTPFLIATNGDISFYEDTGTTAKLFWDASAESLTVGNSSGLTNTAGFSGTLGVKGSLPSITIEDTSTGTGKYTLGVTSGNFGLWDSTSSSYRMFVSSAGNVGMGTSSPSYALDVSKGSSGVVARFTGGGAASYIYADSTTVYYGAAAGVPNTLAINNASNFMNFNTNGAERVRISSAGHTTFGTTNLTPADSAVNGTSILSDGRINHNAQSQPAAVIGRTGTDGAIADFRKNGTTVGSIGTNVGRLSIGSGDTGVLFAGDIDAIYPANGIAARDSAIDLGVSGARFKDLYLSGDIAHKDAGGTARLLYDKSVNLLGNAGTNVEAYNVTVNNGVVFGTTGGSVSSKTLDDYEEGTWTPVIAGSGGGAYTYTASATARYTKIGNLVTLSAAITNIELSGSGHAGYVQIQGAPFNKDSSTFATGSIELSSGNMSNGQTFATVSFISASETNVMYIRQLGDNSAGADFPVGGINSSNTDFNFTITYQTA